MAPGYTDRKVRWAGRLLEARKAAGLTQEAAAQAVGTSRRHWIRWESGETEPHRDYLSKIAEVLGDESLAAPADEEDRLPLTIAELDLLAELMKRLGPTLVNKAKEVA